MKPQYPPMLTHHQPLPLGDDAHIAVAGKLADDGIIHAGPERMFMAVLLGVLMVATVLLPGFLRPQSATYSPRT